MTRTSSGLRSRQSGIRCGSSGTGTGAGPAPAPAPEHLNPGPDGRDPGPENEIPVSGFPLIAGSLCSTEPLSLRASYVCPMSPCHRANMSRSRPLVASRFSHPKVQPDPVFVPSLFVLDFADDLGLDCLVLGVRDQAVGKHLFSLGQPARNRSPG